MFLTTLISASRTLQSRFSNVRFSFFQTCGKDYDFLPHFILLTVWKITTLMESNEFPLVSHYLVGIGNSQSSSFVTLSMVFAGFRTIPAMNVVSNLTNLYLWSATNCQWAYEPKYPLNTSIPMIKIDNFHSLVYALSGIHAILNCI